MYTREEYIKRIDNNRIRVFDLLKYCIKKWKLLAGVFCISFIVCIVFIFIAYRKEPVAPQALEMDSLSVEQRERVDSALRMYQELENIDAYKREAIYMDINAFDCNITMLQYLISPQNVSDEAELYELYANFIKNGRLNTALEEKLGERMKHPADLVSLIEKNVTDGLVISNQHILCIKVVSSDEESSGEIIEVIKQAMEDYRGELLTEFNEHDLKLISQDSYQGTDYDIRDKQDNLIEDSERKRRLLSDLQDLLSEEEKIVLESEKGDVDEKEEPALKSSKFSWIYIIIAIFASGIIACGFVVFYYVYCNRIKLRQEMVTLFDVPVLGEISGKMKDEELEVFGRELELYCLGSKEKEAFISQLENDGQDKLEFMKKALDNSEFKLTIGGNICKDPEAAKEAVACKNLILVYQLDKTTYRDLDALFQKCSNYGINVMGAICKTD